MIPLSECRNRFLYRINCRNLSLGVFKVETGGFIGLRRKFDRTFAFEEYHWDNGPPYGTVRPNELLEELPEKIILDVSLGSRCGHCHELCEYILFPEGPREKDYGNGYKVTLPGEWLHIEKGNCEKAVPYVEYNKPLEEWLR